MARKSNSRTKSKKEETFVYNDSFLKGLRFGFILLVALLIVYGYYLHTEGELLVFFLERILPPTLGFLQNYWFVVIGVGGVFYMGYWCGSRWGKKGRKRIGTANSKRK